MSYGHRYNLEQVFFELAEENFNKSMSFKGTVEHADPVSGDDASFDGYPSSEGISLVSIAIVSWATSLEAFTNLLWNIHIAPNIPEGAIRKVAIKQLSTLDKIKEILNFYEFQPREATWWSDLTTLFKIRNKLVHYKEEVVYQGFSFADPTRLMLKEDTVTSMRTATTCCIQKLGELSSTPTDFTTGRYNYETVLE